MARWMARETKLVLTKRSVIAARPIPTPVLRSKVLSRRELAWKNCQTRAAAKVARGNLPGLGECPSENKGSRGAGMPGAACPIQPFEFAP